MFANVFTKTTRDRLPAGLFGVFGVGVFLFFALWAYGGVDTRFYYDLPPAFLELFGISADGSGSGGIAFGAIYNFIGALTVAGLALTWGAATVAGEERDGTLGLLLSNPVSRRGVLISKTASLVLVLGLISGLLYVIGIGSAAVLDVSSQGLFIGAVAIALFLNSLFYGFLALAIGAWTGNRGVASGASSAVMVVGYIAASLLPLANIEWLAQVFPWYYYSAGSPVTNGLNWGDMAVLAGLSVVTFSMAYIGIQRRDLREKGTNVTILDRLRANPVTRKAIERMAGSTRVSSVSLKTFSDFQFLLTITAAVMFYMGVLVPPLFNFLPDDLVNIFATFPDALKAMVGGVDYSTPQGFLTGEVFAIVGPIAIIVLTASMGSRSLAGEEENQTMGLLMSNPITRSHLIIEKVGAMVADAIVFGIVTFLGTWIGVRIGGLDAVGVTGLASITFLLTLFGLAFGGIALAFSAGTGKRRLSVMWASGIAVATWFMFSFFPLSDTFDPWVKFSPWHWYLGYDPMTNGMDWAGAALLAGTFVITVLIALRLFSRRDLRG